MNSINEITEGFLEEATHDSIGLWAICDAVRWDLGLTNDEEVKTRSLDVMRSLIDRGLWPGNFKGGKTFVFWDLPDAAACLARIDTEWDAARGDPPGLDAICWFRSKQRQS